FARKRVEKDLDAQRRKAELLKSQAEGSLAEKLQLELREYKEILKCTVCLDRRKEEKIVESRHRKCPVCAASFGANHVKHETLRKAEEIFGMNNKDLYISF
ncbi:E3 ubiquitin-protein ligase BRE1-like protein, partial [Striga asiatica]